MTQKPRRIDYNPDNFIAGVAGQMSADQLGVYWLICTLIYSHGGPVDYDEKRFAALLPGTHWRTIRSASERLQELGKITLSDGHVMAKGCAEPLQAAFMRVSKATENGIKGGRPPKETKEIAEPDGSADEKLTRVTPLPLSSPPSLSPSEEDTSLRSVTRESKPKFSPPSWIPQAQWAAFLEMRKKLHAPMTDHAMELTVAKLDLFRTKGHDPGAVLDQSVERGWKGVFEVKSEDSNGHGGNQNRKSGATSAHQSFLAGGLLALAGDGMSSEDIPEPVNDPPRLAVSR